jgi:deoxyribose-phosphate aldolase
MYPEQESNGREMKDLASYIDHTLLRADAVDRDIERLCAEALENGFFGVCIHGSWVPDACRILSGTGVAVISVAGFPLGAASTESKCFETGHALESGAREIDVVLNIGRLKQGDDSYVGRELSRIVRSAEGNPVKVILETCLLDREEKVRACRLAVESGARFVKTSTGFNPGGATVEDVRLLREYVRGKASVKASGGIRDTETALAMIEAGADRIGTSSGVAIVRGTALPGKIDSSS